MLTTAKDEAKPQYNVAEAWIGDQYTSGPWDAVGTVDAGQWNNASGYEGYPPATSVSAAQGSSKPKKKGEHKSSGKK